MRFRWWWRGCCEGRQAWAAIICLGVIIRGETVHARQIGDAVSASLARLQIERGVPVIHEVLLLENEAQARARCLGKTHNRGAEAAQTALEMARVMAHPGMRILIPCGCPSVLPTLRRHCTKPFAACLPRALAGFACTGASTGWAGVSGGK